jgi:hypothetical protein
MKTFMKVGKSKLQPSYLSEVKDIKPSTFELLGGGKNLAKDGTYYYTVRLANGVTTFISSGILRAEQEQNKTKCFMTDSFKEGEEYELNPALRLGVKEHKFVIALA